MFFSGARRVFLRLPAVRGRAVVVLAGVVGLCGLWAVAPGGFGVGRVAPRVCAVGGHGDVHVF